jgi:hypothetical protein
MGGNLLMGVALNGCGVNGKKSNQTLTFFSVNWKLQLSEVCIREKGIILLGRNLCARFVATGFSNSKITASTFFVLSAHMR